MNISVDNIWLIVVYVLAFLILFGVGGFILYRFIRKKSAKKVRKIDYIIPTETLGSCHLQGTTEEFSASYGGIDVSFLVRNGVIVGHRPNSSSSYVMYPIENRKESAAK